MVVLMVIMRILPATFPSSNGKSAQTRPTQLKPIYTSNHSYAFSTRPQAKK